MIPGQLNIIFGWAWMCVGLILGLVMGMRSEGEQWLGGYASLTRRYLRLGHVAFIALSIINILYGRELESAGIPSYVGSIGSPLPPCGRDESEGLESYHPHPFDKLRTGSNLSRQGRGTGTLGARNNSGLPPILATGGINQMQTEPQALMLDSVRDKC